MGAVDEILAGYENPRPAAAAVTRQRMLDAIGRVAKAFLPPLQPTLRTGTGALVAAALAWLAPP
jgi:hypothetical protein